MDFEERFVEEYLKQCAKRCNLGGYSRLSIEKDDIRNFIMFNFSQNKFNKEIVSRLSQTCEDVVFSYLDELTRTGERIFDWPIFHEEKLRERINKSLREV